MLFQTPFPLHSIFYSQTLWANTIRSFYSLYSDVRVKELKIEKKLRGPRTKGSEIIEDKKDKSRTTRDIFLKVGTEKSR